MNVPSSEFVQSAIVLGLIAVVGAYLRNLPVILGRYVLRLVVATVVIDSRSNLFDLVIRWFDEAPYSKRCRLIAAKFASTGAQSGALTGSPHEELLCTPAPGLHLLLYRGRIMLLYRELAVSQTIVETLTVAFLFAGRAFAQRFLDDVIETDRARTHAVTKIYTLDKWGDSWKHAVNQTSRTMESIFLPDALKESIRTDLDRFYKNQHRYISNGIAWTRGYLFVGLPGTGKTSLIKALAHEFRLNLCLLSLVDPRLSDATLNDVLTKLPPRAALVIEDIDSFFMLRRKEDDSMRVSFSGLLNALDGAAVADGRVLFLTTNNAGALDSALIRPGRVDRVVQFQLAGELEVRGMFEAFYGTGDGVPLPTGFGRGISPASVQESMLRHPDDPAAAVKALNLAET